MTQGDGSNGTAATSWGVDCSKRIGARSNGGRPLGDTLPPYSGTVSPETLSAVPVKGRPCCIGHTIAGDIREILDSLEARDQERSPNMQLKAA